MEITTIARQALNRWFKKPYDMPRKTLAKIVAVLNEQVAYLPKFTQTNDVYEKKFPKINVVEGKKDDN